MAYYSKFDKKVMMFYNLTQKEFSDGLFAVILDNDPAEVYADGLQLADCDFALNDGWENWEGAIPCRVSTSLLWRMRYLKEQKRIKRVQCITDLRKIIAAGNVAKRLFRNNIRQYSGKADKFLLDYGFNTPLVR